MYQKQKALALGKAMSKKGTALAITPRTIEDRVIMLEAMMQNLLQINASLLRDKPDKASNAYKDASLNKQGIPIGTCFIGTIKGDVPRVLSVTKEGYFVGVTKFSSLSAAAEAVSGITRKSGWVFWKLPDGRTAKEAFKNRI